MDIQHFFFFHIVLVMEIHTIVVKWVYVQAIHNA